MRFQVIFSFVAQIESIVRFRWSACCEDFRFIVRNTTIVITRNLFCYLEKEGDDFASFTALDFCSIEYFCLGSIQQRPQFPSECSRVFDWIPHFSSAEHIEHDQKSIDIVVSVDAINESVDSNCSRKTLSPSRLEETY